MSRRRRRRRSDIWPSRWRRHPVMLVVVVLLLVAVALNRLSVPLTSDHDRYHNRTFTCVRVVDGDTIHVDAPDRRRGHTRVRLIGVDAPETAGSPRGPMHYGDEATAFVTARALDQPVRLVLAPDRQRDRYDRLLAYVYLDDGGRMLNEELVARGYAYADRRFDHPWKVRFVELEGRARRNMVGLWRSVTPEQMPEWRQRVESNTEE